jgi:5-methylcytosine-specific restriction endonuclease McrA
MRGNCEQCGKEFDCYPSQAKRFCSRACHSASTWLDRACPVCGKAFRCRQSEPAECCSRKCARNLKAQRETEYLMFACDNCGKEVQRRKVAYEQAEKNHFCDRKCFGEWLSRQPPPNPKNRVECTCRQCGKAFDIVPSAITYGYGRFCSHHCRGKWQFIHNPMPVPKARRGSDNYNWRGGVGKYRGPNWKEQRRQARKRDNYTCRRCGVVEAELGRELDVHHIRPFREFGKARYLEANDLDNLITLCHLCHLAVEPRGVIAA